MQIKVNLHTCMFMPKQLNSVHLHASTSTWKASKNVWVVTGHRTIQSECFPWTPPLTPLQSYMYIIDTITTKICIHYRSYVCNYGDSEIWLVSNMGSIDATNTVILRLQAICTYFNLPRPLCMHTHTCTHTHTHAHARMYTPHKIIVVAPLHGYCNYFGSKMYIQCTVISVGSMQLKIHTHTHCFLATYMYVHVHVHVCTCTCIYMYVHVHTLCVHLRILTLHGKMHVYTCKYK